MRRSIKFAAFAALVAAPLAFLATPGPPSEPAVAEAAPAAPFAADPARPRAQSATPHHGKRHTAVGGPKAKPERKRAAPPPSRQP